jgi:hypothetical protein
MERIDALNHLEAFVDLLAALPEALAQKAHATQPAPGAFSLIEHAHHLADLEAEGFAVRLARLLAEDEPELPDFEGERIAAERAYRTRDLASGLSRFAVARRANVSRLRSLDPKAWARAGLQQGVGRVTLGELPGRMLAHDCAHAGELGDLLAALAPQSTLLPRFRSLGAHGAPCASSESHAGSQAFFINAS